MVSEKGNGRNKEQFLCVEQRGKYPWCIDEDFAREAGEDLSVFDLDTEEEMVLRSYIEMRAPYNIIFKCFGDPCYDLKEIFLLGNSIGSYENTLKAELIEVLSTLPIREERVLVFRFGMEDGIPRTLQETGERFNVTREYIRQIEGKAFRRLRHPSRSKRLRKYFTSQEEGTEALVAQGGLAVRVYRVTREEIPEEIYKALKVKIKKEKEERGQRRQREYSTYAIEDDLSVEDAGFEYVGKELTDGRLETDEEPAPSQKHELSWGELEEAADQLLAAASEAEELVKETDLSSLFSSEKEERERMRAKILEISIEDLALGYLSYNPLKRHGIKTVEDLIEKKESDLKKVRGLGIKGVQEVIDKLTLLGLSLKSDAEGPEEEMPLVVAESMSSTGVLAEIFQAKQMLDAGIITPEEFASIKSKLIARL